MTDSDHASNLMPPAAPTLLQPVLPGQNSERVALYLNALRQQFEPKDTIEEWWLNDLAHLTARIEHMRTTSRGFYLSRLHQTLDEQSQYESAFSQEQFEELTTMAETDFELEGEANALQSSLYNRLLGLATGGNLDKLRILDDLEKGLLRERDRVFAQFEKRRRDQVMAAVRTIESQTVRRLPSGE